MVAAGAFWTLLGLGVVGDSPTSAEHFWAILGPAVAGLGIALGIVVLTGGNRSVDRVAPVTRVVVDVMPKPEILDPQGKAVQGALPRLGFEGVSDVRQGKRFELEIEGEATPERLAEVERMAELLLSNPVIENFAVRGDVE